MPVSVAVARTRLLLMGVCFDVQANVYTIAQNVECRELFISVACIHNPVGLIMPGCHIL